MLHSLEPVVRELVAGRMVCAAIDIPIGLADRGPRRVTSRRAAPSARAAARSSRHRCVRSLGLPPTLRPARCPGRAHGKGISKQLYNILDKIRAVDALQTPRLQDQLFEMSPELSFAELTGRPMPANKRTAEGRAARRQALASASAFGETVSECLDGPPPPGAKRDDVVDALIGAWTARRRAAGVHTRLGGETDKTGLRMEIIV